MLVPKYSVRNLLAITTLVAMFAAVLAQAMQGADWAIAVSLGIGSLVLAAMLYTLLFCVAWLGSSMTGGRDSERPADRAPTTR
ncbi:MAG: hypothetical protein RIC55_18375 [Pirellulaceae bacterium]